MWQKNTCNSVIENAVVQRGIMNKLTFNRLSHNVRVWLINKRLIGLILTYQRFNVHLCIITLNKNTNYKNKFLVLDGKV